MASRNRSSLGGIGKLSVRPEAGDGLVARTLTFVYEQLTAWRDDPERPDDQSEPRLNSSLCDFLDCQSRSEPGFPMARFKHEEPQVGLRRVDIGVHGMNEPTVIGVQQYTKSLLS